MNMTVVKTCYIQKVLEIEITNSSFTDADKLTLFYQSGTAVDIYYFKDKERVLS